MAVHSYIDLALNAVIVSFVVIVPFQGCVA